MTTFERVLYRINMDPYFRDFTYRKRDGAYIQKFEGGWRSILLQRWFRFGELTIRPNFEVRFDVAHKWFEKYSFKTLADQRNGNTVGANAEFYNYDEQYDFDPNDPDFDKKCDRLITVIKNCAKDYFNRYRTIGDVFKLEILPRLEGEKAFYITGADWFFEYLTICRLAAPERYEELKAKLYQLAHTFMTRKYPEPNMKRYYDRLNEIIGYMESQSEEELYKSKHKKE